MVHGLVQGVSDNESESLIIFEFSCERTPSPLKVMGGVVGVTHKILVSAPVPLELILTGFDWVGAGLRGFGFGDRA